MEVWVAALLSRVLGPLGFLGARSDTAHNERFRTTSLWMSLGHCLQNGAHLSIGSFPLLLQIDSG